MTIKDSDARFQASEQILKHQLVFISHNVVEPLTRYPNAIYKGFDPAPFGRLVLTNERILFLFDDTPYTGDKQKDKAKAVAKGAVEGAALGVAHALTFGASGAIEKLVSWQKGKLKKGDVDFSIFKNAKSSVSIPLNKFVGYKIHYKNPMTVFSLTYPFEEAYLSLNYRDDSGNDHWICIYSYEIGKTKPINPNGWLKAIKKVTGIHELTPEAVMASQKQMESQKAIPSQGTSTSAEGMLKCSNCGKVQPLAKFCGDCGTALPEEKPASTITTEIIPTGMVKCSNCGKIQSPAKFCGDCGKALPEESMPMGAENMSTRATVVDNTAQTITRNPIPQATGMVSTPETIVETPTKVSGASTIGGITEENPEEPYMGTTRVERFTRVLFDENVREDILNTNYNLEAGIAWVGYILFWTVILSSIIATVLEDDFWGIFGFLIFPITIVVLLQLVIILLVTYIAGKLGKFDFSFGMSFRIYTYSFLGPLIVAAIYSEISRNLIYLAPIFYVLDTGIGNLILAIVEVLIMANGYKTLFKTNYLKAFLILAVIIGISYIPVIFLRPALSQL